MSAQRTTRGYFSVSSRARGLLQAVTFMLLALPLAGCGTGSLWDKFTRQGRHLRRGARRQDLQ
ncbi:hypothetical protein ACVIG9_008331 [Bradyrhizobium ottawaense]